MRSLNRDGFITSYVSSISTEDFESSLSDRNQLRLEARLRKEISTKKPASASMPEITLSGDSPWKPFYSHGSIFLDQSDFYHTLKRVRMISASTVVADEETEAEAILWTYMSTGVYLNGSLVAETAHPVYKPIQSVRCSLHLKAGKNDLLFISDNLGVRDTRNMLAFQFVSGTEHISTTIPCQPEEYDAFSSFLDGIRIGKGILLFPGPAPSGVRVVPDVRTVDYAVKIRADRTGTDVSGLESFSLPEGIEGCSVVTPAGLRRNFEFSERIVPERFPLRSSWESHFEDILSGIASVTMLDRGDHGFSVFSLLARKRLGIEKGDELDLLRNDIALIKRRGDCADFIVCGLLRYMHEYGIPAELSADVRDALLDFRYWMTMKGTDGMCFWSENHSLMFWFSACDAGSFYPDDYFHRAGMTGRELHAYGERRVDEWLDDILENGYEEFLSSTYMCVTFAVLLNVYDYCAPSLSVKAGKALDMMMRMLADSTFDGALIAPMGRVYRGVVYPFREPVASLLNAADEEAWSSYGEGWIAFMASSGYRFPEDIGKRMRFDLTARYLTGNAMVSIEKTDSYMLTAVLSPRTDDGRPRWRNTFFDEGVDAEDNHFVKSLNECFHGTSCFQPGAYGYQQHMWSAALSASATVFVNHPGTTSEEAELRPGYWNGNGVMPAITAEKGMIAAIYSIPENHPVGFTHLYLPENRFSEVRKDGPWIFLAERNGYLAVWMSGKAERYDDVIAASELRLYDRKAAYAVFAGSSAEETLDAFIARCKARNIDFSRERMTLSIDGRTILTFIPVDDRTQYLD